MAYLTGRRLTPELMDDPAADPRELNRALGFLRLINRRFGGAAAALTVLDRWSNPRIARRPLRILDVGTGSADIPLAIVRWARQRAIPVHVTGIDRHQTTLAAAREYVAGTPEIELIAMDALELADRFNPDEFDVAHAGLFLHHLTDIEVMTVLRAMQRVARIGVIWNDLVRRGVAKVGVALATLGAPPMARHDALVSVDAGFTKREAIDLTRRVGLEHRRYRTHLCYRFTLTSTREPID